MSRSNRRMRRIFSFPTSSEPKNIDTMSKGTTEITSIRNHLFRYVLMIVGWWKTSCPSSGSMMATKKFRKMSITNSASTERLIQNITLHVAVSRNATSTGVTTAVNNKRISVTRSHRRMYHVRGDITKRDFCMNALCFRIICAPTATCITSSRAFPTMPSLAPPFFLPPPFFSPPFVSPPTSHVLLICLFKSVSASWRWRKDISSPRSRIGLETAGLGYVVSSSGAYVCFFCADDRDSGGGFAPTYARGRSWSSRWPRS
mmetsp:Transcript_4458/g.14859  ORF Transcript_4458/g.14859 Transcript_4458/m.14859 type:complete len:259 (-) Transcript_4458:275-1051(-)